MKHTDGVPVVPTNGDTPTIRFELADVKRVPVKHDLDSYYALNQSSQEGVKFPVALAEIFGAADEDVEITMQVWPKAHFHMAEEDEQVLEIIVDRNKNEHPSGDACRVHFDMGTVGEPRVGVRQGFNALLAAKEVYKIYRNYHKGDPNGAKNNTDNSSSGDSDQVE